MSAYSTSTTDYPNTSSSVNTNNMAATASDALRNAKDSVVNNSAAAYNTVANHPITQNAKDAALNMKDTIANGPVAENVQDQAIKTQNEFSNLAAARTTPSQPAATGQPLTHYHSFFSSLLSWENPRASAIAYILIVACIFAARYLNLLSYVFKFTWMTLGVVVAAEIVGKTLFSQGIASQMRPRRYYTMPKETLDNMIGDVHELVNFFIIEAQRILFVDNILASAAVCVAAFSSFYLMKIVPFWGLCLIGTTVLFIVPLVYVSNQELIDHHIRNTTNIVNQQTEQVKQLATHHATVAANTTKQYASDYTAKAQEMVGVKPARSTSPEVTTKPIKSEPLDSSLNATGTTYKSSDFPSAPTEDFMTTAAPAKDFTTTTAPAVGNTASALRDDETPIVTA